MELGLSGKVVVITGGSSGIGSRTARRFADEGADIFICARREDVLAATASEIAAATGRDVGFAVADITEPGDIDRLRDAVAERFNRVDILINNAGTGIYKPFLEISDEELTNGMALNFFGQFRVAQRFVPMMIAHGGGVIVNVTGTSGMQILHPPFYSTCTGPAKAAEHRFTKALAFELGPHNIRVNAVAPSFVNAPERLARWTASMADEGVSSVAELQRKWAARVRLPDWRWATLDEVANTILFAASPASSYTTGEIFVVDGGAGRG